MRLWTHLQVGRRRKGAAMRDATSAVNPHDPSDGAPHFTVIGTVRQVAYASLAALLLDLVRAEAEEADEGESNAAKALT